MKNTLYLISNEKIFQNNEMFFCDNLDMKSTPEGLNKKFDISIIARRSKKERSHKMKLKKTHAPLKNVTMPMPTMESVADASDTYR